LGGEEKGRRLSASSFYFAYLFISAPDDFVTVQSESSESKNHLAQSRSPYLLQHVANPVDWHEWGETAFHIAKERDMPIFLSVGYSTCHWCHVMAHESFENEAIASKMNSHFVNIKVDREERPDVDRIYMAFVQSLTGGGGWPMSVWLTPDLKPFYGGTYFPPQNRYGRIGFSELIDKIGALWREKRADLSEQSNKYVNTLTESSIPDHPKEAGLTMEAADRCLEELDQQFDDRWGGFGAAPKFPMPSYLSFLLERVDFGEQSEEERKLLGITLDRMAEGGIRDFIVGGFHRYSVDRYWHVPHFEKMLYDQGQLATVYADSSRLLGRMDDLATASEIVSYVGERLAAPEGGIYSAEDADSPLPGNPTKSGEGAFYVWKAGELKGALDEKSFSVFSAAFGIRSEGNTKPESDPHGDFRGYNVLMRSMSNDEVAQSLSLEKDEVAQIVRDSLILLKSIRSQRPRPHLDDKVLAGWNAYMISGACKTYQSGGDASTLSLATAAGEFVYSRLFDEPTSTLYRAFRIERGDTPAFAEDYASSVIAFVDLYESTGDEMWLIRAERFAESLIEAFWDEKGHGFFATPIGDESLIARLKDDYDGAEPSANSLAAIALLKLGSLLGDERYDEYARKTIEAFRYQWSNTPRAMALMLVAQMRTQRPAQQIVVVGDRDSDCFKAFREAIFAKRKRHSVLLYLGKKSDWIATRNMRLSEFERNDEGPAVYLCENYTCRLPVEGIEALEEQLCRS
jgi:uncharacterized protein YyaL (SSP411 family)